MRARRAFVATVSAVVHPLLVATVAAGVLTFTSARVFAESGVLYLCSDPRVTQCQAALQTCTGCGGPTCACTTAICAGDAGTTQGLLCSSVTTCDSPVFESCADKGEGDECAPGKTCARTAVPCYRATGGDGGSLAMGPESLACTGGPRSTQDASHDDGGRASSTDAASDAGASPSPGNEDDGGCSLGGGVGLGTSSLAPLAALVAFAVRARRRARRTPR